MCVCVCNQIPVVLYHGTQQEREDIRRKMFANSRVGKFSKSRKSGGDKSSQGAAELLLPVVVTSYDMCMRDQRFLENRKWKFLVVDEGHRIKNLNCKLIRYVSVYGWLYSTSVKAFLGRSDICEKRAHLA